MFFSFTEKPLLNIHCYVRLNKTQIITWSGGRRDYFEYHCKNTEMFSCLFKDEGSRLYFISSRSVQTTRLY